MRFVHRQHIRSEQILAAADPEGTPSGLDFLKRSERVREVPRGSEKLRNRFTVSHSKQIDFAIKLLSNYCILSSDQYQCILGVFQARQMSVCHIRFRAFGPTGVERERI